MGVVVVFVDAEVSDPWRRPEPNWMQVRDELEVILNRCSSREGQRCRSVGRLVSRAVLL